MALDDIWSAVRAGCFARALAASEGCLSCAARPPYVLLFLAGGCRMEGVSVGSLAFLEEKLAPRHAVLLAASLRLSTAPSSLLSSHPTLHHARAAASRAAVGPIRQKEKLVAKQCSPDPFSLFELLWDVFLRSCYPLGRMNTHTC